MIIVSDGLKICNSNEFKKSWKFCRQKLIIRMKLDDQTWRFVSGGERREGQRVGLKWRSGEMCVCVWKGERDTNIEKRKERWIENRKEKEGVGGGGGTEVTSVLKDLDLYLLYQARWLSLSQFWSFLWWLGHSQKLAWAWNLQWS